VGPANTSHRCRREQRPTRLHATGTKALSLTAISSTVTRALPLAPVALESEVAMRKLLCCFSPQAPTSTPCPLFHFVFVLTVRCHESRFTPPPWSAFWIHQKALAHSIRVLCYRRAAERHRSAPELYCTFPLEHDGLNHNATAYSLQSISLRPVLSACALAAEWKASTFGFHCTSMRPEPH
jgi:hypothetical protein